MRIGKSSYLPPTIPALIETLFDAILAKANDIRDPFEQAFFAMFHLPDLQPFIDGNKRVSRLAANLPLFQRNLAPLSFVDVSEADYTDGMLAIYELNDIRILQEVFIQGVINTALADAVRAGGVNEVSSSDYLVKLTENTGARSLVDRVRQKTADEIVSSFIVSDEFMEKLKFSECLPKRIVQELLRGRMLYQEEIQDTLGRNVAVVVDETSK